MNVTSHYKSLSLEKYKTTKADGSLKIFPEDKQIPVLLEKVYINEL